MRKKKQIEEKLTRFTEELPQAEIERKETTKKFKSKMKIHSINDR